MEVFFNGKPIEKLNQKTKEKVQGKLDNYVKGTSLTTGEMIDKLKVGEVAEVVNKPFEQFDSKGKTVMYDQGSIKWQDTNQSFLVDNYTSHLKWNIRPNYVSFKKALATLNEGRKISCFYEDKKYEYRMIGSKVYNEINSTSAGQTKEWHQLWDQIIEGKWTIEDTE